MARMARALGAQVVVCGPFGGEAGEVAEFLARRGGIRVRQTQATDGCGAYVHDRRDDERFEVARMHPAPLGRHEIDDLFGAVLVESLDTDLVLLAGAEPADAVPDDFYARLARDLRVSGRKVLADLSGAAMAAASDEGLDVLKISHVELIEAGLAQEDSRQALIGGARKLTAGAVDAVVVSRAVEPTLVVTASQVHEVISPQLTIVDHRGTGDSLTAAIGVGLARGAELLDAVRLGVAAGALNVARHGLGSGERDHIERFAAEVTVKDVSDAAPRRGGSKRRS